MTLEKYSINIKTRSEDTIDATMSIVTSFENASISRREWDELVIDAGGDIYSSYDWCRIWWQHYGSRRSLRLFICRRQDRVVGLAPMFVERIWLGPFWITIAKPVGADFTMDVFGLPILVQYADSFYKEIVSNLIEVEKCDAVWFGFVPAEHHSLIVLRRLFRGGKDIAAVARDTISGVVTRFDLPERFEAYVAALGKAARQNFRRQLVLLKKASSVDQVVVQNPANPQAEFRAFNELHTTQWKAEGLPGHFSDWPGSGAFNQALIAQFGKLGRLRMVHLYSDKRLVASQYAFTFGRNGYWRLAARTTEKEFARYGLGVLGLMQMLEQMCSDGIERVEGGYGRYPYKVTYGAKEQAVSSLLLKNNRSIPSIRVNLFIAISNLIHLLYYRIWRIRIAPKIRRPGAPLWQSWIRLRI